MAIYLIEIAFICAAISVSRLRLFRSTSRRGVELIRSNEKGRWEKGPSATVWSQLGRVLAVVNPWHGIDEVAGTTAIYKMEIEMIGSEGVSGSSACPSQSDDEFVWIRQTTLGLHQLLAWVMLRNPLAVEDIGAAVRQDAHNLKRDPLIGYRSMVAAITRAHPVTSQKNLGDVMVEIVELLVSGDLACTGFVAATAPKAAVSLISGGAMDDWIIDGGTA
jgi:hypothetical protein